MHECGDGPAGAARCARKLSAAVHDWVCFNDKEVTGKPYQRGASALTALLHRRFGRYGGGGLPNASSGWPEVAGDPDWTPEPSAGAHLNLSGARPGYCGWTTSVGSCTSGSKGSWNTDALGIRSLADCMARCRRCANCRFVSLSLSRAHRDCSWYRACDPIPNPNPNPLTLTLIPTSPDPNQVPRVRHAPAARRARHRARLRQHRGGAPVTYL